jgi:hypothetical protein
MSRGREPSTAGDDCLTIREAYLAMYYFIEAYWQRGRRTDGSVTLLLSDAGPTADPGNDDTLLTTDPAFWSDWLAAIEAARSRGVPREL